MKRFLSLLCCVGIIVFLSSCSDSDSGGSSGGSGDLPQVSYTIFQGDEWATCYNADDSVIMNPYQTCTWNCATYDDSKPAYWKLTILWDEATGDHTLEDVATGRCRN